jgi:hypothetical protein
MTLPGLTAEVSLYGTVRQYRGFSAGAEGQMSSSILLSDSCMDSCAEAGGATLAVCALLAIGCFFSFGGTCPAAVACLDAVGAYTTACAATCAFASNSGAGDPVDPAPTGCPSGETCFGSVVCDKHNNCSCVGRPGCLKSGNGGTKRRP